MSNVAVKALERAVYAPPKPLHISRFSSREPRYAGLLDPFMKETHTMLSLSPT
jgi:hypothetical protein